MVFQEHTSEVEGREDSECEEITCREEKRIRFCVHQIKPQSITHLNLLSKSF